MTAKAEMEGTAEALNEMFRKRGSKARVLLEGRYGYTGLDLGDENGGVVKNLTAGTRSDVTLYLRAMMEALWLLEEPYIQ
jgi:hypothetical protein